MTPNAGRKQDLSGASPSATNEHKDQASKHVDELDKPPYAAMVSILSQMMPDHARMAVQQLKPHIEYLLTQFTQELIEEENLTFGGMGSDIPCVPVESIKATLTKYTGGK